MKKTTKTKKKKPKSISKYIKHLTGSKIKKKFFEGTIISGKVKSFETHFLTFLAFFPWWNSTNGESCEKGNGMKYSDIGDAVGGPMIGQTKKILRKIFFTQSLLTAKNNYNFRNSYTYLIFCSWIFNFANPRQRLMPKRCMGGFIFALNNKNN